MTARHIVMDIDSTLINQEVIDLLGEEAGVGEQVAQTTERAMRGELDFKQALEKRGVTATVRRKLGPDIDAACGQLRQRQLKEDGKSSSRD